MATVSDEWHIAAAKVSPMIWEVQKAHNWTPERAALRLKQLNLNKVKDYVGILSSEPEIESMRDRLVIVPINYPESKYKHPFLVERERIVQVYDWNGELEFEGEMSPDHHANFVKWCAGYFIRLVDLKPPAHGP